MDDQELQELLTRLHGEIELTRSVDKKGQELLHDLEADINDLIERSGGGNAQPHPSVIGRLEDSIDHFEVTHPSLASMLTRLLETLSNAGI